ncbi:uncharacterized protein LOC116915898 [Daphnia magna]|uniref:uncharacterized protein LOC116915898 n=1 Tax=Daphnia magna TaxID=35525 RepID=UPI001E1BB7E8|nr:uncharacterized protein LOC116915898 [Daphnia magna]
MSEINSVSDHANEPQPDRKRVRKRGKLGENGISFRRQDCHTSDYNSNQKRLEHMEFLATQISRDVDAEILLFTYFPNKKVGTCGIKQFGKKTQQMCNTSKPLKDFNQYWMMVTSRLECLRNAKTVPPNLFDIQYRGTGGVIDSIFNEQAVGANSIDKESATGMLENYSKGNPSLLNVTTSAKQTPTNESTNFVVCQTTAPTASTVVEDETAIRRTTKAKRLRQSKTWMTNESLSLSSNTTLYSQAIENRQEHMALPLKPKKLKVCIPLPLTKQTFLLLGNCVVIK